ncbi:MAG: hypothetical protein LIO90_06135 [Bacteroidales bacterium]|nr:hypothetical protein [Bacteroidales bacterium]
MLRYVTILAVIGLILAVTFAAADKHLFAKVKDVRRRRYLKLACYALLLICLGILVDIVMTACEK